LPIGRQAWLLKYCWRENMSIEVNSTQQNWLEDETVSQLLARMKYIFPLVVVKINGEVIMKSSYDVIMVPDESIIEVIHLISGG